jgi:hypothetical protein
MNHGRSLALSVGPEEDGRSENPLKGTDQTPVLRSALLHSERVEHSGGTIEGDSRGLLPDREGSEEDWYEPVLSPGKTVARMPRHLQDKLTVSPLVK